ncbi:MAG: SDR family NAD(P)-dependent oxidoreductase [Candidatus Pacebacteria bacterium]|nr:SDR family NAD(P)-dependent oxidoreductase [Candidatus Paceibacterota bacterium]
MKKTGKTKVIVTGGAGFIGSHLVEALVQEGYEVHVIDNLSKGKREQVNPQAVFHQADVRNQAEIKPIFAGAEAVFHLAAIPQVEYSIQHPIETNDVNVNGTLNVLMAAKDAGVKRIVYSASGGSVYGDQDVFPVHEKMLPKPKSPYAIQKYIGEHFCRIWSEIHGVETVSLRYFNVYGPGAHENGAYALVTALFLKQKREGVPLTITGDGKQTRDFVHVSDVAWANLLALTSKKVGRGEVINIGSGKESSVLQIAEMIGGTVVHIAPRIEPRRSFSDITLAKKLLGWEPKISLEKGIRELKKLQGLN